MKKLLSTLAFAAILAPCTEPLAQQSCLTVMDCPGGYICKNGVCVPAGGVSPDPAPAPAPAPSSGFGSQSSGDSAPSSGFGSHSSDDPAPSSGFGSQPSGTPPPSSGHSAPSSGFGSQASSQPADHSGDYDAEPAGEMMLSKGTMQLGGHLALRYEHFDDGNGYVNGTNLEISPTFGYFVAPKFELVFSLAFIKGFGEYYEGEGEIPDDPMIIGASIGIRYHIPVGSAFFYLGLDVGIEAWVFAEDNVDPYKWFIAAASLGFLVPLNNHVAIDIGVRPQYNRGLDDPTMQYITAPIGYLGVQAFF
jgi:hypothetical protein